MKDMLVAAFTLIWPPIVLWIAVRLFPGAIAKYVNKEIERRSDAKLERFKAELQGAYAGVKSSVEVLTASNSGMRPHIIEAVTALWARMTALRARFGGVIVFDNIILADEAQEMFEGQGNLKALSLVEEFEDAAQMDALLGEFNGPDMEPHRLFCGDRLWLLFYIYRAVILRGTLLINWSYEQQTFRDWRADSGVKQQLRAIFDEASAAAFESEKFGGLASALSRIEAEFLHEAARVMSGSKAMADSLSDVQALIALRSAEAGARIPSAT